MPHFSLCPEGSNITVINHYHYHHLCKEYGPGPGGETIEERRLREARELEERERRLREIEEMRNRKVRMMMVTR